jgi:hypothetical protein
MASTDAASAAAPAGEAVYDNFSKMCGFMDPHLLFPWLTFLEQLGIYDAAGIARARLELAKRTKMSDYAVECYKGLHGEDAPCPPGASSRARVAPPARVGSSRPPLRPSTASLSLPPSLPPPLVAPLRRAGGAEGARGERVARAHGLDCAVSRAD